MASYVLTIVGYPASDSTGTFEWSIAGAKAQLLAAGRGTIAGSGHTASLAVERLTYHALLAGLQAFLAEDYAGALTIAAAPAFIALLRPGNHAEDPDLQRLRQHAVQLLNQIRGELTLHEQRVVPPLFVEATELARRAAKPLPPRVIAFITQLNANPGAVTDEDLNRLQIRGTDTYSRIRLPELLPLVEPAIVAQAQAAFPDAPASQAVVLRWHLRGLNLVYVTWSRLALCTDMLHFRRHVLAEGGLRDRAAVGQVSAGCAPRNGPRLAANPSRPRPCCAHRGRLRAGS